MIVLDTTVLVYATGGEHPLRAPCRRLVGLLGEGALVATTTGDVVQAYAHVRACQLRHEVATGLLFIDEGGQDMHAMAKTVTQPLVNVPFADLCPGNAALQSLMEQYR